MSISVFDLFKIGIGPSSSHTVGPMRAANRFLDKLMHHKLLSLVTRIEVKFYGSLALTGEGHGTFSATLIGLMGKKPDTVPPEEIGNYLREVRHSGLLPLAGIHPITFDQRRDFIHLGEEQLPYHPNGMTFIAYADDKIIRSKNYYSIGGGFVVGENTAKMDKLIRHRDEAGHSYQSAKELMELCASQNKTIPQVILENELTWRPKEKIDFELDRIWQIMQDCVQAGLKNTGTLPGILNVERRAHKLHQQLCSKPEAALRDPLTILDWVNLYALAVNEENAAYGRVVTAPTNGAAGIIPACLHYYKNFCNGYSTQGVRDFLLTAGAIGILYKKNASISGAEVGCQGEVGVACSMAAAGLTYVLGGTTEQIENAAEIGMEHNLGLTCDPIAGLVQIPCIERNAMASIKAINAARMALRGEGKHFVSLDSVMKTMMETGKDMQSKYKETAKGGLAVCVTEC